MKEQPHPSPIETEKPSMVVDDDADGTQVDPMDSILTYRKETFRKVSEDADDAGNRTETFRAEFSYPELAFSPTFIVDATAKFKTEEERVALRKTIREDVRAAFALISTEEIHVLDEEWEDTDDDEPSPDKKGVIVFKVGVDEPTNDQMRSFDVLSGLCCLSLDSDSDKEHVFRANKTITGNVVARKFWIYMSGGTGTAHVVNVATGDSKKVTGSGTTDKLVGKRMRVWAGAGTVYYNQHGLFHIVPAS